MYIRPDSGKIGYMFSNRLHDDRQSSSDGARIISYYIVLFVQQVQNGGREPSGGTDAMTTTLRRFRRGATTLNTRTRTNFYIELVLCILCT